MKKAQLLLRYIMLAVVKKHRTNHPLFEVKGDIPSDMIDYLEDKFGDDVQVLDDDEESVGIFESSWFKDIQTGISPGETIKIYRQNFGLTQAQLGANLGNFSRQNISDIERGTRGVSKEMARKLSALFRVGVERFL